MVVLIGSRTLVGDLERVKTVRPFQRCREQEEFLRFPKAVSEGPLGLPADISALGYKIRFTDEITGGYKVNVLRDDGRSVARGISLRKYFFSWEKSVKDNLFDNTTVALKLSSNCPAVLRITVIGDGEVTSENVRRAMYDISQDDGHSKMAGALFIARAASGGFDDLDIGPAVTALADCLGNAIKGVRVNAAYALGEYARNGGGIGEAEDGLMAALGHPDSRTRRAAARALTYSYITSCDNSGLDVMLNHPIMEIRAVAKAVYEKSSTR